MKLKKLISILLLITMLLPILSAVAEDDPKKAYAGTTIHVLLESHVTSESMVQLLSSFEEETGIKVEAEVIPYAELQTKAALSFSQADSYYDVIFNNYIFLNGFVENEYVAPLDGYINDPKLNMYVNTDDFIDGYLAASQANGTTYMLPVYGESIFFMYRKDIFDEYGIEVPKTLDELYEAAKTVYEKSNGSIYGIALRGSKSMLTVPYAVYLWSNGGRWFDETGKCVVDSPEGIEAVEMYVDIMNNYAPAGYANFGWPETRTAFDQGIAAMCIDATVNGAYNETSEESTVAGKVGYATVPLQVPEDKLYGYPCSLTAHGLYLNKLSENPEAAFLFMSWATAQISRKSRSKSPLIAVLHLKQYL